MERMMHIMDVVIVGASGGIGLGLAKQFAMQTNVTRILATYRSSSGRQMLENLARQNPGVQWIICHFNSQDSRTYSEFSQTLVDFSPRYVVNTIGQLHPMGGSPEKKLEDLKSEILNEMIDVNVTSHLRVLQMLIPTLRNKLPVTIASLSARVGSIEDNRLGGWYAYRMSKAALNMLIKTTSIEFTRLNTNSVVVALHPGTVDTKLSRNYHKGLPVGQLLSAETASSNLCALIQKLVPAQTGTFFAYDEAELPW
jgi:NAD(P)-dependent dehydrogenase (short-subunit alcohol dehydrogenase family)